MRNDIYPGMSNEIEDGIRLTPKAFKIGEAAVLGMLYEASTWPSPGLVSPVSMGAHDDMDFFLFLKSTSSIAYIMYICAQIGIDDDDILEKLRYAGKLGEVEMLKETRGINTQRGLLFLAGVVCGAAGRCIRLNKNIDRKNISVECMSICSNIVEKELINLNKDKLTNGEKLYKKYGITGIRGEIEKGLPSIINTGLPYLEDAERSGLRTNASLVHTLIALMTVVEDTTVVNRCGLEGLEFMRNSALHALELGGMKTAEGEEFIRQMDNDFIDRKISPGGAADLLAVTVMIKKLERDFSLEI